MQISMQIAFWIGVGGHRRSYQVVPGHRRSGISDFNADLRSNLDAHLRSNLAADLRSDFDADFDADFDFDRAGLEKRKEKNTRGLTCDCWSPRRSPWPEKK